MSEPPAGSTAPGAPLKSKTILIAVTAPASTVVPTTLEGSHDPAGQEPAPGVISLVQGFAEVVTYQSIRLPSWPPDVWKATSPLNRGV